MIGANDNELGVWVDEPQLIHQVRQGDPAAERALYDAHVDRVYRLAYRMTGDAVLAQDCTQDTFIRAFERITQFREEAAFATWLRSIAVTVILNALRRVKRFRRREVALDEAQPLAGGARRADPDLKDRLREAINDLPHKYRTVFVMHDVEGYTHEEIAQALGVATGTSKAQLFRARARLRQALSAFAAEGAS